MTGAYKKLEELANCITDAHKELASEIKKICEEDGVSEDHHPLHHSAQNILRLERLLGELVKAMASDDFEGNSVRGDLKNTYLQRVIEDADFIYTGFARVLNHAAINR